MQGPDPAALNRRGELSFRIGESDLPPPDWQAGLGPCLSKAESGKLEIALREGDTTAVINLLFKPEKHPTSGQFYVRPCQGDLLELVRTHGAPSFTGYPLLVLYSSDFNRAGLQNQLLQRQATDQRASLRPERSSLAMAAQWGDIELFQTLWSHANDDQRDTYAEAALHQFAANGMTGMVHQLLPHAKYASSNPGILCAAAAGGHTATCAALLKAGADLHTASRALASAAASGHTATCAFLISIGAHVDGVARFNHPLLEAVTGGHLKTCKLLIAAGARLDRDKSDKQSSILARAVANGDVSLYQFLLDQGAATVAPVPHAELLAIAARANQVHMLNYLLKPDDDLELADANGDTLLLSACKADATEAVAYLLERGSRVIPKGSTNDSAIVYALNRRHLPLVELFLRADVPAEYWANNLGLAAQCASPEVISAIMDLLGDQFSTWLTPENNPLLSIPYSSYGNKRSEVQEHHQRLSRLLSNARLPLNHISSEGDDALTLAVAAHDIIAVDMLVKAGFGISHRSQYQKNAIGVALQNFVRKNDAAWIVDNDRGAAASSILRTLSRILLQKDDRFSLAYEVYDRQYLPVPRDLAMFLMFADSESTVDLASMMIRDRDLTGDICRSLMAVPDTASIAAISTLGDLDIPSAMNIRLRSLLRQLAPLRDILFKHGSNINNDRAFLAAVDGIYLILASQRDEAHVAADIAAYYASAPIDDEWKAVLTRMASQWLTRRIAEASEREGNRIGQVFGELFDRCAADSVDGDDYVAALKQSAPEPGKVAAALHEAGIYAALADEIDVAWSQAWQRVKLSPAALLDLRSNDQLADELLAAFRQALNDRVDKPSAEGHLINRINEPAEAAALYTDLMFQQLHMLKQFSSPEPH